MAAIPKPPGEHECGHRMESHRSRGGQSPSAPAAPAPAPFPRPGAGTQESHTHGTAHGKHLINACRTSETAEKSRRGSGAQGGQALCLQGPSSALDSGGAEGRGSLLLGGPQEPRDVVISLPCFPGGIPPRAGKSLGRLREQEEEGGGKQQFPCPPTRAPGAPGLTPQRPHPSPSASWQTFRRRPSPEHLGSPPHSHPLPRQGVS